MTRVFVLVVTAAAIHAAAFADNQAVINLAGVVLQHATNQSRSSSPDSIDPGFGYRYVITGTARGTSGILAILYPNATPIEQILDTLGGAGASDVLTGEAYSPSGTHPLTVVSDRFEGSSVLLGTTVTAGVTITAGIDAGNFATFTMTDVVMLPNSGLIRLGALQFSTGTATITRIPAITGDMNWDGVVNNFDIDPFVLALTDPATYVTLYGFDSLYPGDVNRDGVLNNFDIDPFVAVVAGS
ncbi:MAG: hypothetical protein AB7Q17_08785 [Phycisphaerae bacterium]